MCVEWKYEGEDFVCKVKEWLIPLRSDFSLRLNGIMNFLESQMVPIPTLCSTQVKGLKKKSKVKRMCLYFQVQPPIHPSMHPSNMARHCARQGGYWLHGIHYPIHHHWMTVRKGPIEAGEQVGRAGQGRPCPWADFWRMRLEFAKLEKSWERHSDSENRKNKIRGPRTLCWIQDMQVNWYGYQVRCKGW